MGNEVSMFDLQEGDVIYRPCKEFEIANHYGIYIGNGRVIYFSRELGMYECSFEEFASGHNVSRKNYKKTLPRRQIVKTARYYYSNPHEWEGYNVAFNNCEHFASFCATGNKSSGQVKKTVAAVIGVAAVTAVAVGVGAVVAGSLARSSSKDEKDEEKS